MRMAAKEVLVSWRSLGNQKEAEWLPSLEEGKNYRQKYFQSFSDVFRGEEVASSLFL